MLPMSQNNKKSVTNKFEITPTIYSSVMVTRIRNTNKHKTSALILKLSLLKQFKT